MTIMDNPIRDIGGYDATVRDYERTLNALNVIMRSKRVSTKTRIQARQLHDAVYTTGRINGTGDWIRDVWADRIIGGNITAALIVGLFPLLVLSPRHPYLAILLFGAASWGVWTSTRIWRGHRVRRSRRIPS